MEQIRRLFQEGALLLLAILQPAARSVRDNVGLAALSVVLAFVLWIFVTDTEGGSTRSGTLPDVQLEVQPVNVPRGLTVSGDILPVRVRVDVDEDVWDDLRRDDFQATVDLADLFEGRHAVPVRVEARTSRGRLEVLGSVPPEVDVTLVPLFSKSVPVEVQVLGQLPEGMQRADPLAEPDTVTVSGAEAQVALVSKAVVHVDISDASSNINRSFPLEARDDLGQPVTRVALDPPTTNVTIAIERKLTTRVLTVSVELVGEPEAGYNVTAVSASPPAVTVSGPRELMDSLSVIRTAEVDIEGLSEEFTGTVKLETPAGVSVSGSGDVSVRVSISAASGRASFGVTPGVVGLGDGLRVVGTLPTVEVALEGPQPVLNSLTPGGLTVRVDVSGLPQGTHSVLVKVEPPEETRLISTTPAEIPVILQTTQ